MTPTAEMLREAPPATLDMPVLRAVRPGVEMRAAADDGQMPTMAGHFSVFNSWYEIDSWFEGRFLERIAPGSFRKTFQEQGDRIRALLEHGHDPTVGDKPLGSPQELREDSIGAYYEVPLFDTSYTRDLVPALEAGVYGASFRFRVIVDEWNDDPGVSDHNPEGIPERTIREMRVFEFGPTIFPASPTATAGLRSASLTDRYLEQLRRRNPDSYDELVRRAADLRTPAADDGTGAAPPAKEPHPHSEVDTPAARLQARRRERLQARGLLTPTS